MSIPFHMRIQVRQFLGTVQQITEQIDELYENIRKGRKGVVPIDVVDYVKLLEEVRRVEYIMLGIAVSGLGISLQMPNRNIPATDFRLELDKAILSQLEELNNDKSGIIITDDNSKN